MLSTGLKDEEGFIAVFKQVHEVNVLGRVGQRAGETLANNHVPASALVLQVVVLVKQVLQVSCNFFVKFALSVCSCDVTGCFLLKVLAHVAESNSVGWEGSFLDLNFFV